MILKRTLQSICILTVNPNTTTSVIVQVSVLVEELNRISTENERLKGMVSQVCNNYSALQSHVLVLMSKNSDNEAKSNGVSSPAEDYGVPISQPTVLQQPTHMDHGSLSFQVQDNCQYICVPPSSHSVNAQIIQTSSNNTDSADRPLVNKDTAASKYSSAMWVDSSRGFDLNLNPCWQIDDRTVRVSAQELNPNGTDNLDLGQNLTQDTESSSICSN